MSKEQKIFSFDEVVDFLQSVKALNKLEAEKEFANYLAKINKVELVPNEIADKLISESQIDKGREILEKAHLEVLFEIQKGQKKVKKD